MSWKGLCVLVLSLGACAVPEGRLIRPGHMARYEVAPRRWPPPPPPTVVPATPANEGPSRPESVPLPQPYSLP